MHICNNISIKINNNKSNDIDYDEDKEGNPSKLGNTIYTRNNKT